MIKVEGDESNAHSRGHCCAKSQSSMLALYHPDRLRYCLKRTNPKGEDDPGWVRISLADAFDEAGAKFNEIVEKYGGEANFAMGGTSRVWAQPPVRHVEVHLPDPERPPGVRDLQGPAPLRRYSDRRDRLALDGSRAGSVGVRAVGHRCRVLQLRLHEPYSRGLLAARL